MEEKRKGWKEMGKRERKMKRSNKEEVEEMKEDQKKTENVTS